MKRQLKLEVLPIILLILVSICAAVLSFQWYEANRSPTQEEVIEKAMVNTFMVSTEALIPGNPMVAVLGLQGHGTGFVYSSSEDEAIVVTNWHVISKHLERPDLTKVALYMINRPWAYDAEVIGWDKITDIAVLKVKKIDDEPWEALTFDLDKNIREGEEVITVGHGLSQPYTVSKGIVSGTDRFRTRPLNFMIQHTAIINVGNSGGPVVNMDGNVVAVNSMILSPSSSRSGIPAWDGVAFAIPTWQVEYAVQQILDGNEVVYPRIDFLTKNATVEMIHDQDIRCNLGDKTKRSYAYVELNDLALHAEAEGLQTDDIILSIDDERVYGIASIAKAVINKKPGTDILIKLLRDCQPVEVTYELLLFEPFAPGGR